VNGEMLAEAFRKVVLALGVVAAVGLIGYAVAYLVVLPRVRAGGFVPESLGAVDGSPSAFAATLAAFASLYALVVVPVVVVYAIKGYRRNPYGIIIGASLVCVSSLIEIVNNLPVVAAAIYPGELQKIPAEVLLRLAQEDAISYLALDVLGFALIYAAYLVIALADLRDHPLLLMLTVASVGLFALNIPFLWLAPGAAVVLMAASVVVLAAVPLLLAWVATRGAVRTQAG
jgi:hypothetical protein